MPGVDMTRHLVETAYRRSTSVNEFNDKVYTLDSTALACLYRDNSIVNRAGNREEVNFDGLLWFDSTTSVEKGDVFWLPGDQVYVMIQRVIRAKRLLLGATTTFIKCEVTRQRQVS